MHCTGLWHVKAAQQPFFAFSTEVKTRTRSSCGQMSHFVHVDAAVGVPVGVSVGEKGGENMGGCRWSVGARRRACVTCASVNVCVGARRVDGQGGRGG